ncbi:MAG: Na+/H+ antiporter [Chloroflexota bacterium]|nr:MAG: Na+/H+ antiporter [Chloroflexota bacterium]
MQQPFTAAAHHDVLVLLVQISVLLLTARLLGELALRLGQPAVVGEILAGILLGPSLLSGLSPTIEEWLIPQTPVQGYLLETISLIGLMLLLLITGLEIDLSLVKHHARSAAGIAVGGLSLTISTGIIVGLLLPKDLLASGIERAVFALFLAIALAISALPVLAKVLIDLKLTRRDVGQTIIAAAMIDDTVGWILISVVVGLASGAAISVGAIGESVGSIVLLMGLSFTVMRWLVKRSLDFTLDRIKSRDKILTLVVLFTFAWGAFSQALHLEALLGAFLMGVILSQMPKLDAEVIHKLESLAFGIFSPIFFAVAGLKVNIGNLLEPRLMGYGLLIMGAGILAKTIGIYIGARLIGKVNHWTALFFGSGLNARGSMGIIVANIGLQQNIITQDMFSIIVVMAVLTSLLAPVAMRQTFKQIQPSETELERLRQESLSADNLVTNIHRVLLPLRYRENTEPTSLQIIAARVLDSIGKKSPLAITLMSAVNKGDEQKATTFLTQTGKVFNDHEVQRKVASGDDASDLILDEAKKGYQLMVLGATQGKTSAQTLFTPIIDTLVRLSPSPTLILHGREVLPGWRPRHILIPTNGSIAARRAAEVGIGLAVEGDEELVFLRVVESGGDDYLDTSGSLLERQMVASRQMVDELEKLGEAFGVRTFGEVKIGREPETIILEMARQKSVDLIILGVSVQAGSERLYLGPRVERILGNAPCPVIVVNTFS